MKNKKQAWSLFFLIPIITIIFVNTSSMLLNYGNNYNIFSTNLNKITTLVVQKTADATFEKIEYSEGLYNFYIDINLWNSMTQNERENLYELATCKVLNDIGLNNSPQIPVEIINNVTIYDSENNYRLFYCQIPKEYRNIPNKNYKLKKAIRKFSRQY